MKEILAITKALADPNRLRALMMLRHGEMCVCQIIEILGLAPSTVSKHLTILFQAGLVESRKEGRWLYYRLPGRGAEPGVKEVLRWLRTQLAEHAEVVGDSARLAKVKKVAKTKLCECYRCRS